MTIEEAQDKPHGELCAELAALAPQVLDAHAHYAALAAQQRVLLAARTLNDAGLRIGDKVQLRGTYADKKNPIARVLAPTMYLVFQVLRRDGKNYGEPQSELMFDGYEKLP